jgi:hypothetical protein
MTPDTVQRPPRIRSKTWPRLLAIAATAGACGLVLLAAAGRSPQETTTTTTTTQLDALPQTATDAIRPFRINTRGVHHHDHRSRDVRGPVTVSARAAHAPSASARRCSRPVPWGSARRARLDTQEPTTLDRETP